MHRSTHPSQRRHEAPRSDACHQPSRLARHLQQVSECSRYGRDGPEGLQVSAGFGHDWLGQRRCLRHYQAGLEAARTLPCAHAGDQLNKQFDRLFQVVGQIRLQSN